MHVAFPGQLPRCVIQHIHPVNKSAHRTVVRLGQIRLVDADVARNPQIGKRAAGEYANIVSMFN